jgi:hypothetical protein
MRKRLIAVVVGLTASALSVGVVATPSGAAPASWEAVAAADGFRLGFFIANFVAVTGEQVVDVAAPAAQAAIDSIGNSTAYAAHPYPGVVVAPNPAYPFIASTSWPRKPEASLDAGAYRLTAHSEEQSSEATAKSGVGGGADSVGFADATARAVRDPATGAMTSESASTIETLAFGSALRLTRIHSEATVIIPPDGVPQRRASMEVGRISIQGEEVRLTEEGFALPGTTIPIERDHPLLQELSRSGIAVEYLKGFQDADGVVAPGIKITVTQELPAFGTGVISYTVGRSSAHARAGVFPEAVPRLTGGTDSGSSGAVPSGEGAVAPPQITAPGPPTEAQTPAGSIPEVAVARPVGQASARSAYIALLIAGVAALLGGQLVRVLGIRLAWKRKGG